MDLKISEMLEMQRALLAENPQWGAHTPENGVRQLLWLAGELGEVIDVVKKQKIEEYMASGASREHFVEEFCDVLMYFIDCLDCYKISPEELSEAYKKKFGFNMTRDWE